MRRRAAADRVFVGGGVMGELSRSFDWSRTALGPVETWPQSLKTTASTCLDSRFAIVVWWGPELVTLYNDGYAKILGNKHPQALGMRAADLWPEIWPIIGPMLAGVMERGEATWSDNLLLELERNGYPEESYFTFSYSPIRDESGGVGGVFTPVQETTSQVIGERRLRTLRDLAEGARAANAQSSEEICRLAAQTLQKNLFDVPFAAFYLLAEDGIEARLAGSSGMSRGCALLPSLVRPAEVELGWPFASALKHPRTEVIRLPAGLEDVPTGAWPVPPKEALVIPISPAGQNIGFAILAVSPRKSLDDEYRGFLSLVGSHVTTAIAEARTLAEERKRAEALAEIDRAKTTFFSNVSHEFRTPLTLMLGPLEELLSMDSTLPQPVTELVSVTHRNGLRLQKLVTTLLDFSRIEAGRVQASYQPTDLAAFTAELASTFRSAIEKAGLEFIVACTQLSDGIDKAVADAYVDREMWEKIVLNLLSNAFKYTFEGRISIRLDARDGLARLTVEDTGTGIPDHELPHLFERFHRVEGARGRTQEGTGIGLALVAELVKLHGGTVAVSSNLGQGSVFTVSIPLGAAHLPRERVNSSMIAGRSLSSTALYAVSYVEEAARWLPRETSISVAAGQETERGGDSMPSAQIAGPAPNRPARGRVLVADDNADMRDYVARLLDRHFDVEAVVNGEEALARVLDHPPDLVLSDVMIPRLDGFGLLRALRENPETRALPVILLSARAGEEARVGGLDAGASDYLVKPFTARELLARVGAHLEMARVRKQAAAREAGLRAEAEAARDEAAGILESITDAFAVFDSEWRFTYVNAEAERLLRLPRQELLGGNHWELFPATVGTQVECEYRRAIREQVPLEFEYFYEPWEKWFAIKCYPTREGGLSNYFRDITERKQAEAALRERDALREADRHRWRELLFQVPAAVAILRGPEHIFEHFNDNFLLMARRADGKLAGRPVRDVFPELVLQGYVQKLDAVYRTGIPCAEKGAFIQLDLQGDGVLQDVYFDFVYLATRNDAGQIDGIFIHAVDVTDLVKARKRIEESEERFRHLAESMPQVVWTTSAEGVIDYLNSRWTELTGFDLAATRAGVFREVLLPEDLEVLVRASTEGLLTGQPYSFECRFPCVADGTMRWHLVRAIPVRNAMGEVIKWLGTSTDIDEQKRAAEALRLSDWRLRLTLDAANLGSWELDLRTLKATCSPRHDTIFGYRTPASDWTYAQFLAHVVPEDREDLEREFQKIVNTAGEWTSEYRIRRVSDGAIRWIWGYGKSIPDGVGRPSLMLGLVADITERKEAQTQLAQANEDLRRANADLEQFGYSAGHDLQEPLRTMTIYSQLFAERYRDKLDGEALEILGYLESAASRMQMLVRDLLAYTQMKHVEDPEESDAEQVLAETMENLANSIAESSAQITHSTLPVVKIHKVHLQQLFQNLIGNALKYRGEEPPRIHVSSKEQDRSWLFSVSDNGIGVDAQYRDLIFGLFKRLHSGAEYSGTGIGLAICKRIVERYGGRIWVESIPKEGSTFYFTLPV